MSRSYTFRGMDALQERYGIWGLLQSFGAETQAGEWMVASKSINPSCDRTHQGIVQVLSRHNVITKSNSRTRDVGGRMRKDLLEKQRLDRHPKAFAERAPGREPRRE